MLGANWMHAKNIQYTVLVFNIANMSIWSTSIWSTKALMIKIGDTAVAVHIEKYAGKLKI